MHLPNAIPSPIPKTKKNPSRENFLQFRKWKPQQEITCRVQKIKKLLIFQEMKLLKLKLKKLLFCF